MSKKTIRSTCCYCGVGCGVLVEVEYGREGNPEGEAPVERIVGVRGDPDHPANRGRLCTKGATLHQTARPEYRLHYPELRARRGVTGARLDWDDALSHAARRFASVIAEHGPDAVAFYLSGQLLTEDYYVFNKLIKGFIGTNNIDTNSRLCMSSAVVGYKQTLGADSPPCSYEDIAQADMIFIAGANPAVAHPIVFRMVEDARASNPNLKIVVADPRPTESSAIADLHLPLKPGTDIALFNGILHWLIANDKVDRAYIEAHTEGFAALEALVADYAPEKVAEICGLPVADILQTARWFADAGAALSLYCQGLNQSSHGTHNNAAIIHLHLATGQIGRPGAGPFSLTGQPNAMGGREVGGLSNLLSAHRDMANPAHRAEVAALWGIPGVPDKPGKSAVELFKALKSGEVKAVWIACTNPAQSLPNQAEVREALEAAEFVVVQEAFGNTDTVAYADLLLPAATWGEKGGTVTNSERRITRLHAAVTPLGEARPDWLIAAQFAQALGREQDSRGQSGRAAEAARLFPYTSTEMVFNEHRESTRGRDLDITGLSYAMLETEGPQQWPLPEGALQGKARLYADGIYPTASGKARFVLTEHRPTVDAVNSEYPFSLISGRMRDHWHGMSRTGTVARLFNIEDEPLLQMGSCDMRRLNLRSGDLVRVSNPRGSVAVRVYAEDGLRCGRVWLPMHWGEQFMNSRGANALTPETFDPFSKQPELKHAAVRIEKLDLPCPIAVVRRCCDEGEALILLQQARALLTEFPYATVGLYGRTTPLVVFRAAVASTPEAAVIERLDACFGMAVEAPVIHYEDAKRGVYKKAVTEEGRLWAVRLVGEALAQRWLKEAMSENALDTSLLRFALAPLAEPPIKVAPRNIVCKCADVTEEEIRAAVAAGADMDKLQADLKCGTYCGGCIPDIRKLLAEPVVASAA